MVTCRKCHAGMASLYCRVTPLQDGTKVEEIACRRCGDVLESRPILLEMRRPVERGLMQPGRPRLPVRQLLSVKKKSCAPTAASCAPITAAACAAVVTSDLSGAPGAASDRELTMAKKTMRACADCGRVMAIVARGLCGKCLAIHKKAGTLDEKFPAKLTPAFAAREKSVEALPLTDEVNPLSIQIGGDHYKSMKIQPLEFILANKLHFAEGSVIKYACRHRTKGGAKDIRKAIHVLQVILSEEYGEVL